jgi:Flp pilus assembly pilin Flp
MVLRVLTGLRCWAARARQRAEDELGATAVEYAIMLALIAGVVVAGVALLGSAVNSKFSSFRIP